jgi:hypothetical protein
LYLEYRHIYKHRYTDGENERRKENNNETRMRAHMQRVVTVYLPSTLAFAIFYLTLPFFFFLCFSSLLLRLFSVFISFLNVKCMTTHLLLYVKSKNSHLLIGSALVVITIVDVATSFRCDGWDITLPHECRRSGLNEGTIRKWRLGDNADGDGSWSISASNDMVIDFLSLFYIDESEHETLGNNQTRTASHIYTRILLSLQDQLHFFVSCEYKVDSSFRSIVETILRE